jgi:multiple sugar transport system substrate-binding protein
MKKVLKLLIALTLVMAMLFMVACRNEDPEPVAEVVDEVEEVVDEVVEEVEEVVDEVVDEDAITIRIATWDSGTALEILEQIADDFTAIHPHIHVTIDSIPDGLGAALLTQIAAGDAPDIFQLGDGDITMFQALGGIQSLSPFIDGANGLNLADFAGPAIDGSMVDGQVYAMIKDFSTLAIYYNIDMFEEAGLDTPTDDWTWDDFREMAAALTIRDGDTVTQWGALPPRWGQRDMTPFIRSFGGNLINPAGTTALGYFDGDGTVAALQFLSDMMFVDGSVPTSIEMDAFGGDMFLSEAVAMQTHGTWPSGDLTDAGVNFGTVMLPTGPAGQIGTIFFAGYTMWANTPHPEEAWLFLSYLATEGQRLMVGHALTAYTPVADAEGFTDADHPFAAFIRMIDVIAPLPEFLNPDYYNTVGRQFSSVWELINLGNGTLDIREALEEAAVIGQDDMEWENANR